MIRIVIDGAGDVPPFDQIRTQIADAVVEGSLAVGFRLPPVRQLAGDLGLAPNTVARAYRELELAGIIETRGRHGSFVAGTGSPQQQAAIDAAQAYVRRTTDLGLGPAESLAIVRREIEQSGLPEPSRP